jgi:ATP-binding cassette subfamily B multidrug efflux pump
MATPLKRLLPYHDRYKVPFWGGMFGLLLARVFEATIPLFLRDGIDRIVAGNAGLVAGSIDYAAARGALAWPALAIVLCVLGEFTCIILSRRVIRRIGVSVAYDLRKRVYDHLQHQGVSFFARHPTGDLMARAINDINLVRQLVGMGLRTILVIIFSALVGLSCMFALAPTLTLMLLTPLPVLLLLGWWLARRVYVESLAVQEGFASLSEQVQENLNGIRTVQALVQERHEIERFDVVNLGYATRFMKLTRTNSFMQGLMPWVGALSTVIILGYGGSLVASGDMSIGTFTAFFSYASMVLWPVRQAGQMVTLWQQGASGAQRLFEVLDHPPEIEDRGAATVPATIEGRVELRDLRYRYPGAAHDALAGISVTIEPGETIAVLGRVGAGKTTLLKLFVRLLDPRPGQLAIDGHDVRDFPLAQLRHQVVLVPQDPFLFADLLRHNLSYDNPERDDALIWSAASDADLRDTIVAFADALDTPVGERGVTLSGGQKQRSTLTRGLIRTPPILILDDCFSSVDTETEEHILRRLRAARRGMTTILVSHRVSTARHADRIIVLADGAIEEIGTHDSLIAADGWYAELERTQRRRGRLLTELHEAEAG